MVTVVWAFFSMVLVVVKGGREGGAGVAGDVASSHGGRSFIV
jgi:hypothetical protein